MNPVLFEKYKNEINTYFADGAKKLHKMVDEILFKLGFHDVDNEDYYSLAHEVFVYILEDYDESQSFKGFLYSCLYKKFCTYMTHENREKRQAYQRDGNGKLIRDENGKPIPISNVSISMTIGEDEGTTIGDFLKSKNEIWDEIEVENKEETSEKLNEYLSNLSETQQKIAKMIMNDYTANEIKDELNLTDKQYQKCWNDMNAYEKKRILYKEERGEEEDMETAETLINDLTETYKNTSYSIESISKQLRKKRIKDNHILQRHSGQWEGFAKSELISDILRGKSLTQIIISEEIKNNAKMQWLIDGKQRCTTLDDYLHDGFSISKNVKNYNIRYQTTKVDENGNEVLNEEGFPIIILNTFDIRGKKFSQLPEELQDIFRDRQIPVLYNMNCTKKDIADDIARFNRSRPMNKSQNGWLGLDEFFAEFVENIVKMQFFQPDFKGSAYTSGNHTSGDIRRVVVEAIMVSDFVEDFSKEFDKMCEFLSEEASDSNFTEFYSLIERLTLVSNEKVAKLFDKKDSFLWLGLFSRFAKLGVEDEKFIKFLADFSESEELHNKKINGVTYKELCIDSKTGKTRSTKDKYIVVPKMEWLETFMNEYFGISQDVKQEENEEIKFFQECVSTKINKDDVDFYKSLLDDYTVEVDEKSSLLESNNTPSLIAIVGHACEEEKDEALPKWFVRFFANNNTYIKDQKENYLHMKKDFDNFVKTKECV